MKHIFLNYQKNINFNCVIVLGSISKQSIQFVGELGSFQHYYISIQQHKLSPGMGANLIHISDVMSLVRIFIQGSGSSL